VAKRARREGRRLWVGGPLLLLATLLVPQGEAVALTDVTLIDVEAASAGQARQPARTVILACDRIRWVGPAVEAEVPDGASVIDGAGKFLIPGLFARGSRGVRSTRIRSSKSPMWPASTPSSAWACPTDPRSASG